MAFPQSILDLDAELFLGDTWVDVTSEPAYQRAGFTIDRGGRDESSRPGPSTCRWQLNDRSGNFSPHNPLGDYYPDLDRNTPFRLAVGIATDAFGRSVSSGWGSTDTGQPWTNTGLGGTVQASDFNVAAGKGTQSVPDVSAFRYSYLADVSYRNVEVAVTCSLPFTNVTGGVIRWCILLRGSGTNPATATYYKVILEVQTNESMRLSVETSTGTVIVPAVTVPGLTHSSSQPVGFRAQAEAATVRAKAWAGSDEPVGWHISGSDDTNSGQPSYSVAGWVGVMTELLTGNTNTKPIVASFDDLVVRDPRYAGEVPGWNPASDTSGEDAYIPVETAGILRRINQGDSPVTSALRRGITKLETNPPVAYWPCEDADGSTSISSAIGGPAMSIIGTPNFAADSDVPSSDRLPNLAGSTWTGIVPDYPALGEVMARVVCSFTDTPPASNYAIFQVSTAGSAALWALFYLTGGVGDIALVAYTSTGTVLLNTGGLNIVPTPATLFSIELTQDGADIDWVVNEHPNLHTFNSAHVTYSGTLSGQTIGQATGVMVNSGSGIENLAVGHIAVYPEVSAYGTTEIRMAIAHARETAGRRIERLCNEEGILFSSVGDLDDTPIMGVQRNASLPQLLNECADTDLGTLYEPRGAIGLEYRTHKSRYNQDAVLDVDFSAGELADSFQPYHDDQQTRNDWTVSRVNGSSARSVVTTGKLSVEDPPDGAGRYDDSMTVNTYADSQLPDIASWLTHKGTNEEPRFPDLTLNLARDPHLQPAAMDLNVDDRFTISNATSKRFYGPINLLARGTTEYLNALQHTVTINSTSETPYHVLELDDATYGRADTAGSGLAEAIDTTDTTLPVATTAGPMWTVDAAQLPLDVKFGGERVTVSDIDHEVFTFIAAGTAAHGDNISLNPGLPAGIQAGDLLIVFTAIRNTAGAADSPYETVLVDHTHLKICAKIAGSSESAPTCTYAGAPGNTTSAQIVAFRGKISDIAKIVINQASLLNASEQDINYQSLDVPLANSLILWCGWKQDDWTSVATIAGATEIAEPSSTLGSDQGLVWDYQIQTTATDIPAGSFVVTGGAAAISRSVVLALHSDRQIFTVTRSVNDLVKAHAAGTPVSLADPVVFAL